MNPNPLNHNQFSSLQAQLFAAQTINHCIDRLCMDSGKEPVCFGKIAYVWVNVHSPSACSIIFSNTDTYVELVQRSRTNIALFVNIYIALKIVSINLGDSDFPFTFKNNNQILERQPTHKSYPHSFPTPQITATLSQKLIPLGWLGQVTKVALVTFPFLSKILYGAWYPANF